MAAFLFYVPITLLFFMVAAFIDEFSIIGGF